MSDRVFVDTSVADCGRLLSEDLNDGQLIEGVRIVNPFLAPFPM